MKMFSRGLFSSNLRELSIVYVAHISFIEVYHRRILCEKLRNCPEIVKR